MCSGSHAAQHRGQESSGIVTSDGRVFFNPWKDLGRVQQVFVDRVRLEAMPGHLAIGHNRYATTGNSGDINNVQPCVTEGYETDATLGHNGNVVNIKLLRKEAKREGYRLNGSTDSEILTHRFARAAGPGKKLEDIAREALEPVKGAYSLVAMLKGREGVVAVRDPWGFRPLVLGKYNGADIVCSETCSLDSIGGKYVREVEPGEMVWLGPEGVVSTQLFAPQRLSRCIFEGIYFSRPDSILFGVPASIYRVEHGRQLAREQPVDADWIVGVPDSGIAAAFGYSLESGIPMPPALIRQHYVGRSFIEPTPERRWEQILAKFNGIRAFIRGKRVAMVDDSLVRSVTMQHLTRLMRELGAAEVHVRIASPPIKDSCSYGMDYPDEGELGYNQFGGVKGIQEAIGADSLGYLSTESLLIISQGVLQTYRQNGGEYDPKKSLGVLESLTDLSGTREGFCTGCFTGIQPMDRRGALRCKDESS